MKICVLEFWGLGDAVMMTSILQALESAGIKTTVACKPLTIALLRPSYPDIEYLPFDPPWTIFRGKYRLWRWPWLKLARFFLTLRRGRFDAIVSVRRDPRDHLMMWLSGAKMRLGFSSFLAPIALTHTLPKSSERRPVSEDWQALQVKLLPDQPRRAPRLTSSHYPLPEAPPTLRPVIGLHAGARIPVRRWDETKFRDLFLRLRLRYDFDFVLIPDIDGYGSSLQGISDRVWANLSLETMIGAISACDLLICNDSAPGHIADALGIPVIAIFGPTDPVRFRPYSHRNLVVIRDICPYRPCFDSCRFAQPICLTELTVEEIWPEIEAHIAFLVKTGLLPAKLYRQQPPS